MNVAALPHTLFVLLAELAVGALIIIALLDMRGLVPRGFVATCAGSIWLIAGLAWWIGRTLSNEGDVDGYPLDGSALALMDREGFIVVAFALLYALFTLLNARRLALGSAVIGGTAGIGLLLATAQFVSPPIWGYAGAALSLFAGAFAVGGVGVAMVLGHWYLVTPSLPSRPLDFVTVGLLSALMLQGVLLAVNLIVPVREVPAFDSALGLAQNPVLWLRILTLGFPIVLVWMAWRSSRDHAMQAATGLLYLAMGAVLGGELLGRGLLFMSGRAL